MNTQLNSHASPYKFYEQRVLPALFERLSQAFPEFTWTRTACGWTAVQVHENGSTFISRSIICHQNWGFVDQNGIATSWLEYASRGHDSGGVDFLNAVRPLVQLAGIQESAIPLYPSPSDHEKTWTRERQRRLQECFLGFCQASLNRDVGRDARESMRRHFEITDHALGQLPVGYFTTAKEIGNHLTVLGFSREEIVHSHVVCDPRLERRLIVPWRDRWGRLTTIVAIDVVQGQTDLGQRLYLHGGKKTEAYGLDVALRPGSGGHEHLVLVDDVLDCLYFQSLGVCNVATTGTRDANVTRQHWERLADYDIRAVTLAVADRGSPMPRIRDSLNEVNQAERAPQVFALGSHDFREANNASEYVRLYGLDQFRRTLKNRIHAYRYIALEMIGQNKPNGAWTDEALRQILCAAVEFDRANRRSQKTLELERFFWPTILDSTGVQWDHLPHLLSGRVQPPAPYTRWNDPNQLLQEMERALRRNDMAHFKSLVLSAARCFSSLDPDRASWHREYRGSEQNGKIPDVSPPLADTMGTIFDLSIVPHPEFRYAPTAADIRELAYSLWERRGRPEGSDEQFWHEAERTLWNDRSSFFPQTTCADDELVVCLPDNDRGFI